MGTINHNAVIATTWNKERSESMREWIATLSFDHERCLFAEVAGISNGYCTFIVVPDGSKEGWVESTFGDSLRQRFIKRLREDDYEDGGSPWDWIEVGFGEYGQKVLRGNCKNKFKFNDREYAGG